MKNLPQEILGIICEYADVKCRNGRYMNQIAATDPRRDLLKKIPRIKEIINNNNLQKNYYVNLTLCRIVYYCPDEYNRKNIYTQYKYGETYYSFYCPVTITTHTIYKINLSGICFIRNENTT